MLPYSRPLFLWFSHHYYIKNKGLFLDPFRTQWVKHENPHLHPTLSGSRMHRPPILGDYETLAELLPAAQPCGNIQRMSSSRVIPLTLVVAYTYTPSSRPGGMPYICNPYVYRGSWVYNIHFSVNADRYRSAGVLE